MNNAGIFTEEEFNKVVNMGKPCVFDFSATWCGPCKMFAPVMEDIAAKYSDKCLFYTVDIDSADNLAEMLGITAVPTVVIFNNGKELVRVSGYHDYGEFEAFLKNNLNLK